jgi:hypothetical protein
VDFGFSVFGLAYMTSLFFLFPTNPFYPQKCILPAFFFISKKSILPAFFFKDGA